ncbi:MAG: PilZ domain-containing protein [Acidobacteria bacterium]|nr:PilZ domain-containing protein [Acidobacteriota bacterium]
MERRAMEREALDCPIEFDLGATAGKSGVRIHKADAQNICADGLRIKTDHPLKTGMVLRVAIPVRGFKAVIPAFAEVVWAVPAGLGCCAGLRFLK